MVTTDFQAPIDPRVVRKPRSTNSSFMPPLAPLAPQGPQTANLNPENQLKGQADSLAVTKFNQWYGTQKPADLARFAVPVGATASTNVVSSHGTTGTNGPAPLTADEMNARQRAAAREHFTTNVLPEDADYQQAQTAYQQAVAKRTNKQQGGAFALPPIDPKLKLQQDALQLKRDALDQHGQISNQTNQRLSDSSSARLQQQGQQFDQREQRLNDTEAAREKQHQDDETGKLISQAGGAIGKAIGTVYGDVKKAVTKEPKPDQIGSIVTDPRWQKDPSGALVHPSLPGKQFEQNYDGRLMLKTDDAVPASQPAGPPATAQGNTFTNANGVTTPNPAPQVWNPSTQHGPQSTPAPAPATRPMLDITHGATPQQMVQPQTAYEHTAVNAKGERIGWNKAASQWEPIK